MIKLIIIECILFNFAFGLYQNQPCVFEYNSHFLSQGEVYSPNYPNPYPNNLDCRYEFYAKENERVIINIDDFQLEPAQSTAMQEVNFMDLIETNTRSTVSKYPISSTQSSDENRSKKQCFYDFLDVFTSDGHGRLFWRSRHCGNHIDKQIVSTTPTLVLVFQTDRMLSFRGFKFQFHFSPLNILPFVTDPICGPSEISGNGSILGSPNYPMMFPPDTECAWTITVEKHQNILIKFIDVNLNQPCHRSQVSIWDGYVSDVNKPDFIVCEKLTYYHKGILQYKSKSNRLVIKFLGNKNMEREENPNRTTTTKMKTPKIKNGFFLSWNGIRMADDCKSDFQCKGGEYCIDSKNFLCQQTYRYCISKKLVCDGVYNCDTGDESDELHCELKFLHSRLFVSISIIGSFIFALLTLSFCLIHQVNRKKKGEFGSNEEPNGQKMSIPTLIITTDTDRRNSKMTPKIYIYNSNEDDKLMENSNRGSSPTGSSSLESSGISTPTISDNSDINSPKPNTSTFFSSTFKNDKYRQKQSDQDELNKSARRSSYNKAIYLDNG